MRVIDLDPERAQPIRLFESLAASSLHLASGEGETHVYSLYFGPDGCIGEHPTGFGQLLVVLSGEGWAAGADGARRAVQSGQAVSFERGELHSKGSDTGMTALMIQIRELQPGSSEAEREFPAGESRPA